VVANGRGLCDSGPSCHVCRMTVLPKRVGEKWLGGQPRLKIFHGPLRIGMFARNAFILKTQILAIGIFPCCIWWGHQAEVDVHGLEGLGFIVCRGNVAAGDVVD
jgi:hypothetical protein